MKAANSFLYLPPAGIWAPEVQQQVFRRLLQCMARPGRVEQLDDLIGGDPAHLAVLAVLADHSVTLADPDHCLCGTERSRLEVQDARLDCARYILARGDNKPSFTPCRGDLANPDLGATILLIAGSLGEGRIRLNLRGPGLEQPRDLLLDGIAPEWFIKREEWGDRFPLGVDLILIDGGRIAALPRTTKIAGEFAWPMLQ